jgi:hypothetical protein
MSDNEQQISAPTQSNIDPSRATSGDPAFVEQLVSRAANFALFSVPNPAAPPQPVPLIPAIPALASAFEIHESLHRFEEDEPEPTALCGFRISKQIGEQTAATVSMQMTPMPNNFQAAPDRVPPPTVLLPFISQRFSALNGSLEFNDGHGSGVSGFGTGRTYPVIGASVPTIRLTGILDIVGGTGKLAGVQGNIIVNGTTTPPNIFAFHVLFRIIDPNGNLEATSPLLPLQSPQDPDPDTAILSFLSEPDPTQPLTVKQSSDGVHTCVEMVEQLRLVDLSVDVTPPEGLRAQTKTGAIVGQHRRTLILDTSNPNQPNTVIPAYSKGGEFSFFDENGTSIGGFKADLFEARVFPTSVAGSQTPIYRIAGVAPPTDGTGQFTNSTGMVSVNGAFSLTTGAISTVYILRLADPFGKFRAVAS